MGKILRADNSRVTASLLVMGLGQLLYRQWGKGLLFLAVQLGYIYYLVTIGAQDLFGFFTLGSVASNPWYGIEGGQFRNHAHYGCAGMDRYHSLHCGLYFQY